MDVTEAPAGQGENAPEGSTLRRLSDLMADDAEYEEGFLKPTQEAFDRGWELVKGAEGLFSRMLPAASPAPGGDGGIFIQWGSQGRYVRLLVPGDRAQACIDPRVLGGR